MVLEGTWPVLYQGKTVGQCTVEKQGLYARFYCQAGPERGLILRLILKSEEGTLPLGIPLPQAGELILTKKIPAKRLPDGQTYRVELVSAYEEASPISEKAPEPMTEPKPKEEPEPKAQWEPAPEPEPEPRPEPEPKSEPEPEPEAKPEQTPETQSVPEASPQPEPQPEPDWNPKPQPEVGIPYSPNQPIPGLEDLEKLRAAADENGVIRLYSVPKED